LFAKLVWNAGRLNPRQTHSLWVKLWPNCLPLAKKSNLTLNNEALVQIQNWQSLFYKRLSLISNESDAITACIICKFSTPAREYKLINTLWKSLN